MASTDAALPQVSGTCSVIDGKAKDPDPEHWGVSGAWPFGPETECGWQGND